ncbi:flavodoxin family protein [Candidatus Microgenomates bacterium]|jgi:flavodoxin|nr:MAG: flavodoxin family protein [Candidatus Microgenomates bacterium]
MNILIAYDSVYGNTEKVARAIAEAFSNQVKLLQIKELKKQDLKALDLFIVGSPTHGGRPTPAVAKFLGGLEPNALSGVKVTAFDTRILAKDKGFGLKLLVQVLGYAASRIAKILKLKGGSLILEPEGFAVRDKEGPLEEGELKRALEWAEKIKKQTSRA